jgi:hypothetical protein
MRYAGVTAGRTAYGCIITAVSLLIIYAVYEALHGEPHPDGRVLLMINGALAIALAVAVWSRHIAAVYVQVTIIPLLAAFYLFESRQTDPIDQMLHVEQFWRLVKAKMNGGETFTVQYSPARFAVEANGAVVLPSRERIFPLAGVAALPTITCREGRQSFAGYEADEHGFNNPKGIWGNPVDVVFIGDSMTHGHCLPNRDHFVAQIRKRYPAILNLGYGGLGPLIELAITREFVPKIRPRYVFYMYDENNDLYFPTGSGDSDLVVEYRNSLLRRYLEDARFSQHVYDRQLEINAALKHVVDNDIVVGLERRTFWNSLIRFLGLPLTRAGLHGPIVTPQPERMAAHDRPPISPIITSQPQRMAAIESRGAGSVLDYREIFKQAFMQTLETTKSAGAKLVFVNIPAQATLCEGVNHHWKNQVLNFVKGTGVDVIDLEKDFRKAVNTIGRAKIFAVPPCGGHFNEVGYKIIGDRLLQYLEMKEALAKQDQDTAENLCAVLEKGWSFTGVSDAGSEQAIASAKVVSRLISVYEPYFKLDTILPAEAEGADRARGAGILGNAYARRRAGNQLRVTVNVTAHSPTDNEIVAALFIGGETRSNYVASRSVTAGSSASVSLNYNIELASEEPVNLEVRIGTSRPGAIYINGDDHGPMVAELKTSLTIEELCQPGQLIYVGSDPSNSEIVAAHRAEIVRRRALLPDTPTMMSSAFAGIRRWVNHHFPMTKVSHFEHEYEPHVALDKVIDISEETVADPEGAEIMGYTLRPKAAGNLLHVRVAVPAWTDKSNRIVVALFVNQDIEARRVQSQELKPEEVAAATLELEIEAESTQPVTFTVRVGPGKPGPIYLNGDVKDPLLAVPRPTLTVDEYRFKWF